MVPPNLSNGRMNLVGIPMSGATRSCACGVARARAACGGGTASTAARTAGSSCSVTAPCSSPLEPCTQTI